MLERADSFTTGKVNDEMREMVTCALVINFQMTNTVEHVTKPLIILECRITRYNSVELHRTLWNTVEYS